MIMADKQRRTRFNTGSFKTRDENGEKYINGYFAVFNSNYEIYPDWTESIASTAFDGQLDGDVRCLIDHDTRLVLGRTKAGTLSLRVDGKGLWGEVKINPNDQDALNLYERVKRGDVDQCSFGFEILEEDRSINENTGAVHWTIKAVKLYEVSIVTFPAYEDTEVSARKKEVDTLQKRSHEMWKERALKKLKGE